MEAKRREEEISDKYQAIKPWKKSSTLIKCTYNNNPNDLQSIKDLDQ
jgi:hypothetical protein